VFFSFNSELTVAHIAVGGGFLVNLVFCAQRLFRVFDRALTFFYLSRPKLKRLFRTRRGATMHRVIENSA
jgi:hypothetical protein